ncbi:MAG: hypothetical protein DRQ13_00350, partial [Ignavibacteriae bacterium]
NKAMQDLLGLPEEEVLEKTPKEIFGLEQEHIVKELDDRTFSGETVNETRSLVMNNKQLFFNTIQTPLSMEHGEVTSIMGIVRDVTEHKRTEEALQESEERYRNVVENAGEFIWQLDTKGNFVFFNKYAEQVSGQKSVDWQGKHYTPFVHPDDLARVNKLEEDTLAGNIIEYETRIFNIKGKIVDLEIQAMPIYVEGEVIGTLNFGRDITERKKAGERLRESRNQLRSLARRLQMIREEERATIAREIHDDLGQSLTALKIDITWMKQNLGIVEEKRSAKIDVMLNLTNSTIKTVKRIATELRPGILDDLGLIPAIEWQAEEFRKRSDIQCNLQISVDEVIIEEDISIAVFRIFQESLTNIVRHSGATKIEVVINRKDDLLQMEVTDNGVGISEEQISSSRSLGLIGMNERVSVLKGKLTISRAAEGGTTVKVDIPLKRTQQSD